VRIPVAVISATADEYVNASQGRTLCTALGGPSRFWAFAGRHGGNRPAEVPLHAHAMLLALGARAGGSGLPRLLGALAGTGTGTELCPGPACTDSSGSGSGSGSIGTCSTSTASGNLCKSFSAGSFFDLHDVQSSHSRTLMRL
jgi:hypothetical protein